MGSHGNPHIKSEQEKVIPRALLITYIAWYQICKSTSLLSAWSLTLFFFFSLQLPVISISLLKEDNCSASFQLLSKHCRALVKNQIDFETRITELGLPPSAARIVSPSNPCHELISSDLKPAPSLICKQSPVWLKPAPYLSHLYCGKSKAAAPSKPKWRSQHFVSLWWSPKFSRHCVG